MPNKYLSYLFVLLFICALSCTEQKPKQVSSKLSVLATTTVVADLVNQIAADLVDLEIMMGPGSDPHLYVPTSRDYKKIKNASIVVFSGLHLEAKLGDVLKSLSKKKQVIDLSKYIDKKKLIYDELKAPDPHYWFDPELWQVAGEGLKNRLVDILPKQKAKLNERYDRWLRAMQETVEESKKIISLIPESKRVLVTSHDAFRYYGRAFGLDLLSVLGTSTDAQVSIKKLNQLVSLIKKKEIPSIFLETSVSPYSIKRIQQETGVNIGDELYGDSLGAPGTLASTYVGMLRLNSLSISNGLRGLEKSND